MAGAESIQEVTVTNDGAKILSLLEVDHPAQKILVDLAQQQDKEVSQPYGVIKRRLLTV